MDNNITNCEIFNGDVSKCDSVKWTKRILAIFSCIACMTVIALIILLKKHKIFSQKLTIYLAVACLLQSICQIANTDHGSGPTCTFLAWLLQFTDGAVLIWICAITLNILLFVIRQDEDRVTREWVYHLVCWGAPFLVSLLPFISSNYGPAGLWCWIGNDWKWRMGVYYIPAYVFTFIMFVVYGYTQYKVFQLHKQWYGLHSSAIDNVERKQKLLKDEVKPVFMYPGVYILLEIIPLVHRIYNAVHPYHMDPFALVLIHSICLSLRGLVNGIVFLSVNKNNLSILKPSQLHVAFLTCIQKDEGLIQEYDTTVSTQSVPNGTLSNRHQEEMPTRYTLNQQAMEMEELDRHFSEMTTKMQAFEVELNSVNPKV